MQFLYNILVFKASLLLRFLALFNTKLKLFVNGRKETFNKLSIIQKEDKVIWIHSASLGEFEQARPIIERLKSDYKNHKVVVTFFSPSGYEIRKNYDLADVVCYLPFDTKANVKKFVAKVHPDLAIIVKYEFWFNLLSELKQQEVPTILVSGIFRENQIFFKSYGSWMRNKLKAFNHFFVQNSISQELLKNINFTNVMVSGDTRFDRVFEILQQDNSLDFIKDFKDEKYTVVAGSTWNEDEQLLVNYINKHSLENEKFIIAPHNINQKEIKELRDSIDKKTVLFSDVRSGKVETLKNYQVFIVDAIGLLTKIYSYADVAYVGGGLKTGLHNILEPATFGIPVVFGGNNHQKFQEAVDLITLKGCISVSNKEEFSSIFTRFKSDIDFRAKTGYINQKYIEKNIGATELIMNYIHKQLNKN